MNAMLREPFHLSDQDLLLVLDGEVARPDANQARAHLSACWSCRSRLAVLESTIGEFVSLHQRSLDPQLPVSTGSLALLKARLAEAAAQPSTSSWHRFLQISPPQRAAAYICAVVLMSALGVTFLLQHSQLRRRAVAELSFAGTTAIPDRTLTPGATRPVSIGDVCSMPHEEVVHNVPSWLRQQVFKEYGIVNPRPEDYEIDYLIAPGLGGAEDIHNLWPEPSNSAAWNAHVKDSLEERLHQLVCAGKLDLPTAQKAIASDWITAYKKYFGADTYGTSSKHYLSRNDGDGNVAKKLALPLKAPV
jgi:hypothetical protein